MYCGWQRGQRRHPAATYRTRVTNLPASYADHAPASATQLHDLILNNYGIDAYHVHTPTRWTNRDRTHALAFPEVANETEGDYLRQSLSGTQLDGTRLYIEWARDHLPGPMANAVTITSDACRT